MSEPLMSVAGQLVGIPAEKYSGTNGVTVDQNNKTIGLDETVLYETSGDGRNSSFTLSEAATNFEFLRFQGIGFNNGPCLATIPAPSVATDNISVTYWYYCPNTDSNPLQVITARYSTSNAKTYTKIDGKFLYWSLDGVTPGGNTTSVLSVTKVVGINRIGGNA